MDNELSKWVDEVMSKQQYRSGIFTKKGIFSRIKTRLGF
tara:strand:+ start:10614 stop:10730 length:117 start_codon:yes stop_codon:yes gene_type:complete